MPLEDSECVVQSLKLWLGEKKMNVLRHQHIAEEEEAVALPKCFKGVQRDSAGTVIAKIGQPTITTEGEKVVVAFGLVALEPAGHRSMVSIVDPKTRGSACEPTHAQRTRMNGAPRLWVSGPPVLPED